MSDKIVRRRWTSPVGEMLIASIGERVCMCDWAGQRHRDSMDRALCRRLDARIVEGATPVTEAAIAQLQEYFAGDRRDFTIPLAMAGTDFQQQVWTELTRIPYGATLSYAEVARRIGHPRSVRAVANAVGANPLSILVPCHRVIGAGGALTGYAGGLDVKRALLAVEMPLPLPLDPGRSVTIGNDRS